MKTLLLLLIGALLIGAEGKTQSLFDKLSNGVLKGQQAKSNLDKVKGWLPKKKASATDTAQSSNISAKSTSSKPVGDSSQVGLKTTVVIITGTDFPKLKRLTENIQACEGVKEAKMKYSSISSTIEVSHSGTTDKLLKLMEETSKDIFTEKNIDGFEDGRIQLKL